MLFALLCNGLPAMAQHMDTVGATEPLSLNQRDGQGHKNGPWWENIPALRGEPAYYAFGSYDHGKKIGPWYRINSVGDLEAIENFRFDVLHGEVKYFEQGKLVCVGHYRGLNTSQAFDTVLVVHPVTGEERLVRVSTQQGALRHGLWQFYDPATGRLIREEEYQVDERISSKTFEIAPRDSAYYRQREMNMPHNRPVHYKPPKGKSTSLTDFR
jgi:hypothetical protein